MYLVADIGGTKTNLAAFSTASEIGKWQVEATYFSSAFSTFELLLERFMLEHELNIDAVCFCVAGPVFEGKANITNLPWSLTEHRLREFFDIEKARLVNDLAATARAIPHLSGNDLVKLNQGVAEPGGTIAVIAPGTGLGEAFLTWDGSDYRPHASEGGHVDFAPTTVLQWGLLHHFQGKLGHVSFERVCSGLGIQNIYQYLKETGYAQEPAWLTKRLETEPDPTPAIVEAALMEGSCDLCRETMNTFVSILGAEAGNMALKLLASGGVYLGGGIPPKILPILKSDKFFYAYRNKGRFEEFLDHVPVFVINNPKTALYGAAYEALEFVNQAT